MTNSEGICKIDFLDTTFLIDLLKGDDNIKEIVSEFDGKRPQATSTINVHELLVGGHGSENDEELTIRKNLLSNVSILEFDQKSTELSEQIEAKQREKGNFIGTADIMIAAIMKVNGIQRIYTRNIKHFSRISGIDIIED